MAGSMHAISGPYMVSTGRGFVSQLCKICETGQLTGGKNTTYKSIWRCGKSGDDRVWTWAVHRAKTKDG